MEVIYSLLLLLLNYMPLDWPCDVCEFIPQQENHMSDTHIRANIFYLYYPLMVYNMAPTVQILFRL